MHSVRKRILEIIKKNGGSTVAELAAELDMAPVSARHHLDILQGDNLICVDRVKRKGNVGRPQQVYGLTANACNHFPNNFPSLAGSLVRQIKAVLPPEQIQCAFHAVAAELASEIDDNEIHELPLESRLDVITDFLTERGYLARWEFADSETSLEGQTVNHEKIDDDEIAISPVNMNQIGVGYLLHKYNCPYDRVSTEHRELCMMDQELVNQMIGRPCCRTQSMADDARCCTYYIEAE